MSPMRITWRRSIPRTSSQAVPVASISTSQKPLPRPQVMTRTRRTMETSRSPPKQWRNKFQSIYIMFCLATRSLDSPSPSSRKTISILFARMMHWRSLASTNKHESSQDRLDTDFCLLSSLRDALAGIFRSKKITKKFLCLQYGVMRKYGI